MQSEKCKALIIRCRTWFLREDFKRWWQAQTRQPVEPCEESIAFLLYRSGITRQPVGFPDDLWKDVLLDNRCQNVQWGILAFWNAHDVLDTEQRVELANAVFQEIFHHTDSFEQDDIGSDLAYLQHAIINADSVDWSSEEDQQRPIVALLRAAFPADEIVWQYIKLNENDAVS